jgi:hypothetical protein
LNTPPLIAFQVALSPTPDQRGKVASIIGEARISGEDQWTEKTIQVKTSAVDTTLPDDQNISDHTGIIQ